MSVCSCNNTLSNTGTPSCQPLMGVAKRLILVPILDSSGARNSIDVTSLPSNSAIIASINATLAADRYFPLPELENVTDERGDSITEEANSGAAYKVRNAPRVFTGQLFEQGTTYAGQIEGFGCSRVGVFVIDSDGNVIGEKGYDSSGLPDKLYPLEIKRGTWDTRAVFTTDTTVSKVQINFTFVDRIDDGDIGFIAASDFASDVDWLTYNGLIDLDGRNGSAGAGAGTATITIVNKFGSFGNEDKVSGLVLADFALYNQTQASSVTLTGASESNGVYTLSWTAGAAVVTSDVLEVRVTADGYDDTLLNTRTVTATA